MSDQPEIALVENESASEAGTGQGEEPHSLTPRSGGFGIVVSIAACLFSLAYWAGLDVSFAMEDESIWRGQYWRFVLCCLVHLDPIHLVFNVYWFVAVFSPVIEHRYGWQRSLLLFVVLAVGSSAASFLFGESGVGLSGVLYGYFGLVLVAGKAPAGPRAVLAPRTSMVLIGWFVLCILLTKAGAWQVGNIAHGAGLIIGAAMGLALRSQTPRPWLVLVGLVALALAPATLYMPWDYTWHYQRGLATTNLSVREAAFRQAVAKAGDDRLVSNLLFYLGDVALQSEDAVRWYQRAAAAMTMPEPRRLAELKILVAQNRGREALDGLVDLERTAEDPYVKHAARRLLRELQTSAQFTTTPSNRERESPAAKPAASKAE